MGTSDRSESPGLALIGGLVTVATGVGVVVWSWTRDARWFELSTTRLGCVTDPRALHMFAIERWAGVLVGAVVVLTAWPVARAACRMGARALLATVLRYGLALLLALAVSEGALRVVHPVRPPPVMSNFPLADADGALGWRYSPLHTKLADFPGDQVTITYDIDADGNRASSTTSVSDRDAPTILFAGESITAGIGLPWNATYPSLVADRLGIQGVNLGVHGYGADQIYLRTLESLAIFKRPVALVTIFVPDELERISAADRAHPVLSRDGSLVLDPRPALWRESALRDLLRRATHYDDGAEIALAHGILRATVAQAHARGAVPLFVMTNFGPACLPDASGAPPLEHVLFDDLGAAHLRVDLDPTWRLKDDPHPDARGARKLADAIASALTALGVGVKTAQ